MSPKTLTVFAVAGLSLALGACGSSESTAPEGAAKPEIALSAIQKANFERFNRENFLANLKTLQDKAAEGGAPAEGTADFAALDKDGNGKLDAAEFALAKGISTPAADDAALEETVRSFFSLDNDGDSNLTQEEFAAANPATDAEAVAATEGDKTQG